MFIPLDERSRTIPISTRKLSKDPNGEGIVTQWGTKDDIEFHDGNAGLMIHSLAHPFPAIWKAVKMFGENSNPMELSASHVEHASAMFLAQEIYREWLRIAGSEKALTRQVGEDAGGEGGADKSPSDEDGTGSEPERDEFDPSGNNEDGMESATSEDEDAFYGDPYSTGPHTRAFDIPVDAPSMVSDSHCGEPASPRPGPDLSRTITLWSGPLPRPRRPAPRRLHILSSDSDSEEEAEDKGRPSSLMPSESRKVLLDRWFKNDYKVDIKPVSIAEDGKAFPVEITVPAYEEDRPVRTKRRRLLDDA